MTKNALPQPGLLGPLPASASLTTAPGLNETGTTSGTGATLRSKAAWGCQQYIGSRRDMVDAGLVPHGVPFPGDVPGKRGSRFRTADGRIARIAKCRGEFSLRIAWIAEKCRTDDPAQELERAMQERRACAGDLAADYEYLIKDPEQFRKVVLAVAASGRASAFRIANGVGYGQIGHLFTLDPETIEAIQWGKESVFDTILAARVFERPGATAKWQGAIAAAQDGEFQRHLALAEIAARNELAGENGAGGAADV